MLDLLLFIVPQIALVWAIICMLAFILYLCGFKNCQSWESCVKLLCTGLFTWIIEGLSGENPPRKAVNPALFLSNQEALTLVRRFDHRPFDSPALSGCHADTKNILWFDVAASGLVPSYQETDTATLRRLCENRIQTYFMETRETQVPVFVRVLTPDRLYFAVPTSEEGRQHLIQTEAPGSPEKKTEALPAQMEEEVEIFDCEEPER